MWAVAAPAWTWQPQAPRAGFRAELQTDQPHAAGANRLTAAHAAAPTAAAAAGRASAAGANLSPRWRCLTPGHRRVGIALSLLAVLPEPKLEEDRLPVAGPQRDAELGRAPDAHWRELEQLAGAQQQPRLLLLVHLNNRTRVQQVPRRGQGHGLAPVL
eukprot:scaffold5008_cov157-Isochrysis_galbana.AAC.2